MKYKVLILGSGGREHAIAWSIIKDPQVKKIYCLPGNGGTELIAENVSMDINDFDSILNFVNNNNIDLIIVGPEGPLEFGIVDFFKNNNKKIFGPDKYSAQLETSKVFARQIMNESGVKQPNYNICTSKEEVVLLKIKKGLPLVIKVDGLAAGKGAYVCKSKGKG